jgi:hypothetical protein
MQVSQITPVCLILRPLIFRIFLYSPCCGPAAPHGTRQRSILLHLNTTTAFIPECHRILLIVRTYRSETIHHFVSRQDILCETCVMDARRNTVFEVPQPLDTHVNKSVKQQISDFSCGRGTTAPARKISVCESVAAALQTHGKNFITRR